MYSDEFLDTFKNSEFYVSCKSSVTGILTWYDWEKCSLSCGGGMRVRIAAQCVPEYAVCEGLQIQREDCNDFECPEVPPQNIPIGSILPWVPKPNFSSGGSARFGDYPGWIKCDGIEVCTRGEFKGQACTNLANRALIGAGSDQVLSVLGASLPNHHHSHTHTTNSHSHSAPDHSHTTREHSHEVAPHTHVTDSHGHVASDHTHSTLDHTHITQEHIHTTKDHVHTVRAYIFLRLRAIDCLCHPTN